MRKSSRYEESPFRVTQTKSVKRLMNKITETCERRKKSIVYMGENSLNGVFNHFGKLLSFFNLLSNFLRRPFASFSSTLHIQKDNSFLLEHTYTRPLDGDYYRTAPSYLQLPKESPFPSSETHYFKVGLKRFSQVYFIYF